MAMKIKGGKLVPASGGLNPIPQIPMWTDIEGELYKAKKAMEALRGKMFDHGKKFQNARVGKAGALLLRAEAMMQDASNELAQAAREMAR